MAKQTKEQFIETWLDKYEQNHPDEKLDYEALREQADCEWYDNEVEHGEKTEYDLTAEQEKTSQGFRKGARAVNAYGKEVKRERKANPDKREIIATVAQNLTRVCDPDPEGDAGVEGLTVTNAERQIDFTFKDVRYSLTLTAHRPPKG